MGSVTWVTRAVLPGMLMEKKAAIVNVDSGSVLFSQIGNPCSMWSIHVRYLAMLSRSVSVEYQHYGIDIQCQIPMLIATKMASVTKTSFFVPSPKQFSKACVRWISYDVLCVPSWTHALECFLVKSMPDSLVNSMILRNFLNLRKNILQEDSMKSSLE
ncbi:hypothetical protein Cgig2_024662 [Carnegiea gigantea]|uniref:Uncharacterized protein n=1 Tax=Carnegiea gigantea TaxID=171969 RepID=A0A9Q1K905_9CARY|nr:hypothetical protein Cgig2_024662 [Carnegiea gigantea]